MRRAEAGQRVCHLKVRILAGEDPAKHLEDGGFAEDQAGVALLGGQHQAARCRIDRRAGLGDEPQRPGGPAAGDAAHQHGGQLWVM